MLTYPLGLYDELREAMLLLIWIWRHERRRKHVESEPWILYAYIIAVDMNVMKVPYTDGMD